MKQYLAKLINRFIAWRYVRVGLDYGDAVSYLYMGKCDGFDSLQQNFKKWEKRYVGRGFIPIHFDVFVSVGGGYAPDNSEVKKRLFRVQNVAWQEDLAARDH